MTLTFPFELTVFVTAFVAGAGWTLGAWLVSKVAK